MQDGSDDTDDGGCYMTALYVDSTFGNNNDKHHLYAERHLQSLKEERRNELKIH